MKELVKTFEGSGIRRVWHNEKWYFSVVDIIAVLTESKDVQAYWRKLKQRLKTEGNETVTKCHALKMPAVDGKMRLTDAADVETMFRIIQSIPSPKAEPIKQWLARVGYERTKEYEDPSLAIDRARSYYKRLGRSEQWIQQRILGQNTRNKLTDYWSEHEINEGKEYAVLTNIIHKEWSDMSVKQHKELKGLKQQNLRDHMSEAELIFTALAELSTRQIAERDNATGMKENKIAAKEGGSIAKKARLDLEHKTRQKVITSNNLLSRSLGVKKIKESMEINNDQRKY